MDKRAGICYNCRRSKGQNAYGKQEQAVIKRNQRLLNGFNAMSDAALIFLSYYASLFLRFDLMDGFVSIDMSASRFALIALVYSLAVTFVFYLLGLYSTHRVRRRRNEYALVLLASGVGVLALMTAFFLMRVMDASRVMMLLFWLVSSGLIIAKRAAVHAVLRHYRSRGYNQKHVIVVGNGHLAQQYIADIARNPQLGFHFGGYVSMVEKPELGPSLGSYEQLAQILETQCPDELIVALEPHEIAFMPDILATADKEGVRLSLIPFFNDYIPQHPTIDAIERTKLIDMRSTPLDSLVWATCKRAMDVVGSLLLIVLTSPVMLAVAIGVKLSSPGPVIFRQERVGREKKVFEMYKFRSMRVTDTQDSGWSVQGDPRKTRFGSLIRKLSLDELPQFFNVLKGDMSLIGPRPEVPYHVEHFRREIPRYLVRQQIRPGMTGWAQVNGLRGDTSIEKRIEYDLWYIENWSLQLDMRILLMTVFGGMVNDETLAPAAASMKEKDGGEQHEPDEHERGA